MNSSNPQYEVVKADDLDVLDTPPCFRTGRFSWVRDAFDEVGIGEAIMLDIPEDWLAKAKAEHGTSKVSRNGLHKYVNAAAQTLASRVAGALKPHAKRQGVSLSVRRTKNGKVAVIKLPGS